MRIPSFTSGTGNDEKVLDAINAAAIFAWANRLMQSLGEPVAAA